jgi:bacterioferritin-associated ferredoxin
VGEDAGVYICLCNGLTDRQIIDAIAAGATRPKEVYCACGGQAQCGNCTRTIVSLLREGAPAGSAGRAAAN